ncbi:heme peroxidase [Pholiota conissans]|uniref:Peroxidase n=1 Tax=Pholiota conissans TaxID=109636 RepID=A0A9P6D2J7_9AGAR|nr:heme peroxidase [Pholiota conissans]
MKMPSIPFFLSVALLASSSATAYTWPSPQYDALEKLLYEGRRLDGQSMSDLASGCKARPGGGNVAAQWLRFAFHDFATRDAAAGTGGVDASLFYELDRSDNPGSGLAAAANEYLLFASKYVSRADVVAIGAALGVTSCGGLNIPIRGGRIDATAGGPWGVPGIDQDIATHTARFATAGLNPTEMILLVACGHTLGGVHSTDFPNVVSLARGQAVLQQFDTTGTKFDLKVASEYLAGTTRNPLVVAANVTLRSDARIFNSDGGATLRSLVASSPAQALASCNNVLAKMLEGVPKETVFTETVKILPAKVIDPRLTVENGHLIFHTDLRLTQAIGTNAPSNRIVTLSWCDGRGSTANCTRTMNTARAAATSQPPSSPVGLQEGFYFNQYSFRVPISSTQSVGKFWFTVKDGSTTKTFTNGGAFYKLKQDNVIYAPRLAQSLNIGSHHHGHGLSSRSRQQVVVGIRSELSPSKVFVNSIEVANSVTELPVKSTTQLTLSQSIKPAGGYKFYSGTIHANTDGLTFDVGAIIGGITYTEDYLTPQLSTLISYTTPSVVSAFIPSV